VRIECIENFAIGKVKPKQVLQLINGEQQSLQSLSLWLSCDCSVVCSWKQLSSTKFGAAVSNKT